MADNLKDIELFAGKYWFTHYGNGKGVIRGPFVTKQEAENARQKYALEETKPCEQQLLLSASSSNSSSSSS